MKSLPTSTEELIDAISRYISFQEGNGFKDKAFLKAAVFRMLHIHCQNGGFPRKAKKFNGKVRREAPHFTALS